MPCDILYNGKRYTLAEFVKLLSENELINKINDNTITGSLADGYRKSFAAEFPSPEKVGGEATLRPELADVESTAKALEGQTYKVNENTKPTINKTKQDFNGLPISIVNGSVFHNTNSDVSSIKKNGFVVPSQGRAKLGYGVYSNIGSKKSGFGFNEVSGDIVGLKMIDLTKDEFGDKINDLHNLASDNKGGVDFNKLTKLLKDNNIDGVITDSEFVVFDPQKIKNIRGTDSKSISEAYHADKAAGKETELTKAVEELLGAPSVPSPETQIKKEYDTENKPRVGGEVRVGEKPVETKPKPGAGREAVETGRSIQGDVTAQEEKLGGQVAPTQPLPKKETKLQKQRREAVEKIQAQIDKEQRRKEREEGAETARKEKEIRKSVMRERAKSAYEGVLQFFAAGGKINASDFKKEGPKGKTELFIRSGKGGIVDGKNRGYGLDIIAMAIAEEMNIPEESYDEMQADILAELKNILPEVKSAKDALNKLVEIQQKQERIQIEEGEAMQKAAEKKQFEEGAAPLTEYYTEEELQKLADEADAFRAAFEKEEFDVEPMPKSLDKRNKIKNEISDIKQRIKELNMRARTELSANPMIPAEIFVEYVKLAAKYIELHGFDAYQFLAALKADGSNADYPDAELIYAHEEAVKKMKKSKFAATVANAQTGISEKVKQSFEQKGSRYIPSTVKGTALSANEVWNEILKSNNNDLNSAIDNAYGIIMRDSWGADAQQVGVLAGIVAKKLNEMSQGPNATMEQIAEYESMAVDVLMKVRERLTAAGKETSIVGKFMQEMFMSYPEAVVSYVYAEIDNKNDLAIGVPNVSFTGTMQEVLADIMATDEGRLAMEQLGIGKKDKITKKYDKRQKAISDAFDRVINDIDSFTSGVSFAVPIPPAVIKSGLKAMKKAVVSGLEIAKAVEIAVNEVADQMKGIDFDKNKARAFFKNIADKVLGDVDNNANPEFVTEQMRKKLDEAYQQKVERAKKALEEFEQKKAEAEAKKAEREAIEKAEKEAKQAEKERLKEEKRVAREAEKAAKDAERAAAKVARETQKERDSFEDALKKLKGDKLRQFAFNVAKNFGAGKGSLSQRDIIRAFQQAMGGVQLTAQQQAQLSQAAKTIAAANKLSSQASPASPQQVINQWIQAQHAASQAAAQINRMLNPRRWVDLFQSTMVMGFITFKTLGANPVSNAIHKLYSSLYDDMLFSFIDVLYAPGQKTTFVQRFKSLFNIEPTKAYVSQLPQAVRRAFNIMKEGSPARDVDRYGGGYDMKPLESWQNLIGDVKATPGFIAKLNEAAKGIYEGTLGMTTATMSRSLTAGDITFRDPEAAKIYQRWADDMGVDVDEFLTSDEFAEYRYYALEYAKMITFQQKNIVSEFIGKRVPKKTGSELLDWFNLLLVKPVIPFFGTPINIKHEMLTMIPPISFGESMYHAQMAKDTKLSDAERFFHTKMAQKMMRRAVGSLPLYAAVSALLASGLMYVIPRGDEEDEAEKENMRAFEGTSGRIVFKGTESSIDGLKFGPLFDYIILIDNVNKKYDETESVSAATMEGLISTTRSTIDNTYLQGLKNAVEGFSNPEKKLPNMFINTYGSAYANLLFPTILSALTQMSDKERVLRLSKDESFVKNLYNKAIRERIGFIDSEYTDIEKLPVRVNVLGEPIKTDREGRIDILHYLFDITRSQPYKPEEKFQIQVYKKYLETEDKEWLYPIAPRNVKFEDEEIKLTPELRNEYQKMLGSEISNRLEKKYGRGKMVPVSIKLDSFKGMKTTSQEKVKKEFMKKYDSQIQDLYKEKLKEKTKAGPRQIFG